MARKTESDTVIVLVDTKCKSNPLLLDLYKQLGFHCKPYQLVPSNENCLLEITNGHFINEQILRTPFQCIALTVQNGLLKGIFIPTKTKLFIFTRYKSIKIDIILSQNLNLVRVLLCLCPSKLSI